MKPPYRNGGWQDMANPYPEKQLKRARPKLSRKLEREACGRIFQEWPFGTRTRLPMYRKAAISDGAPFGDTAHSSVGDPLGRILLERSENIGSDTDKDAHFLAGIRQLEESASEVQEATRAKLLDLTTYHAGKLELLRDTKYWPGPSGRKVKWALISRLLAAVRGEKLPEIGLLATNEKDDSRRQLGIAAGMLYTVEKHGKALGLILRTALGGTAVAATAVALSGIFISLFSGTGWRIVLGNSLLAIVASSLYKRALAHSEDVRIAGATPWDPETTANNVEDDIRALLANIRRARKLIEKDRSVLAASGVPDPFAERRPAAGIEERSEIANPCGSGEYETSTNYRTDDSGMAW